MDIPLNDQDSDQRHTEEMQDIIGAPPAWLLRWGITVFFSVLVLILSLTEVIRYPDMVKTQLKIRSFNLPQAVTPGVQGRLVKLLVRNNEMVKAGQALAEIESTQGKTVLTAPQTGKLTYAGIVHENQEVFSNQGIFYLTNNNSNDFFGEIIIPQNGIGKIKEGQEVMIKLISYPYEEYGMLHGTIKYITDGTSKGDEYIAEVDFKTRNVTDMHQPLVLKQGMIAEADIITQNNSLFKRLAGNIIKNIKH